MEGLERRYRRLLLAYPRRYRRDRGAEMLTTLLDAAEPGRRRPTWREATDIVLRGLRRRFDVPRGPGYTTVAVGLALFCALLGSAGFGWAAWQRPDRVPSLTTAIEVARVAAPGESADFRTREELRWGVLLESSDPDRPAPGFDPEPTWVAVTVASSVDVARDRLVAAGWRATAPRVVSDERVVWAARGDLVVEVEGSDRPSTVSPAGWTPGAPSLVIRVFRATPLWVRAGVWAGGLVGFLVGWALAGRGLRALRRYGPRGRLAMVVLGGSGVVAGLVPLVFTGLLLVMDTIEGGWRIPVWPAAAIALRDTEPAAGLAVLALLGAAAVGAAAPRTAAAERPVEPARAWRIMAGAAAAAHLAFAFITAAVVVVYLALVWTTGEHPLTGAHDPKDLVPFGHGALNPLMWLYNLVMVLDVAGCFLSPLLLAVSVPLLVSGAARRLPGIGRMRVVLVVAVALAVFSTALVASPVGHAAGIWLVD